jgi:hypothetical protein
MPTSSNLTLATIGALDGGMAQGIVDAAITMAIADLDDRGRDGKPRQVVITLGMVQPEGSAYIVANVKATAKLPAYQTGDIVAKMQRDKGQSQLVFETFSPDNPDQPAFPALDEKE